MEPVFFHGYKSYFLIISYFVFLPLLLLSLAPICLIQEEFVRSFYFFFSSANGTSSNFGEIFRNLTASVHKYRTSQIWFYFVSWIERGDSLFLYDPQK